MNTQALLCAFTRLICSFHEAAHVCTRLSQFGPLEETYAILAKFDVSTTDEEQAMLANLHQAGDDFKDMLQEAEQVSRSAINVSYVSMIYG